MYSGVIPRLFFLSNPTYLCPCPLFLPHHFSMTILSILWHTIAISWMQSLNYIGLNDFFSSTSPTAQQETSQLISKSLTAVYGLGTRLHARMHIRKQLENGIQCKRQQLLSVINGFTDQGEFEVIWRCWVVMELDAMISISFLMMNMCKSEHTILDFRWP